MWTGGVQHHAMNCMKVLNYDFVYPIAPGKIFAMPLKKKGVLTKKTLLEQYIMPDDVTTPSETTIRGYEFVLRTQVHTCAQQPLLCSSLLRLPGRAPCARPCQCMKCSTVSIAR